MQQEVEGTLRVAAIYSVGLSEMVELEQEFARRQPEAKLEVEYLRPERIYEAVLAGEADLGLISYPGDAPRHHRDSLAPRGNGAGGVSRASRWPKAPTPSRPRS